MRIGAAYRGAKGLGAFRHRVEARAAVAPQWLMQDIVSSSPEHRLAVRQAEAAPMIAEMLPELPCGSHTVEAIGYILNHWKGLVLHAASR